MTTTEDDIWDRLSDPGGRPVHFDRQGRPISLRQWVTLFETGGNRKAFRRNRRIAHSHVGRYDLSTVWLGLDHAFMPYGPPLIFESMVFERRVVKSEWGWRYHPSVDEHMDRYATEEAARRGHYEMRRALRRDMHTANGPKPLAVKYHGGRR